MVGLNYFLNFTLLKVVPVYIIQDNGAEELFL